MTHVRPDNPLIVQGDQTVLVEVASPRYADRYGLLRLVRADGALERKLAAEGIFLDAGDDDHTDAAYRCAAAVLAEHGDDLPTDALRDAVERGVSSSRATVRKPFYEVGAKHLGGEYRERAREDPAAGVRRWAAGESARGADDDDGRRDTGPQRSLF